MADQLRDKRAFRQSNTTTFREREPTSPRIVNRGAPKMVVDFSTQQAVVPGSLGGDGYKGRRTMNASGKPMSLQTMVGGSGDARANAFGPAGPRRGSSPVRGK